MIWKTNTSRGILTLSTATAPIKDVQAGLRLEALSIVWMVIEAAVSLGAGIAAGSLLLAAFGADSVVELVSACLLFRRLRLEAHAKLTDEAATEALERQTSRLAGFLLYGLSVYVAAQSVYGLMHRHHAETSWPGIAVAVVAALAMPLLAEQKNRIADKIGSHALRADAMETFTCGYLAWVLLAGLAANAVLHWWWLDSAAALVIVPLLIKEGREAISGKCECDKK